MAVAVGPDDTDNVDGWMDDVIVDVVGVCNERGGGGGGKRDDVDVDDDGGSGGGGAANEPATAAVA